MLMEPARARKPGPSSPLSTASGEAFFWSAAPPPLSLLPLHRKRRPRRTPKRSHPLPQVRRDREKRACYFLPGFFLPPGFLGAAAFFALALAGSAGSLV